MPVWGSGFGRKVSQSVILQIPCKRTGPDIVCSMDEKATKDLIVSSNEIWQMRGGTKEPAK
jgi:sialic acid synthase SpsE